MRFSLVLLGFLALTVSAVAVANGEGETGLWIALALQVLGFLILGWAWQSQAAPWWLAGTIWVPALIAVPFGAPEWGREPAPLAFIELTFVPAFGLAAVFGYTAAGAVRSRRA